MILIVRNDAPRPQFEDLLTLLRSQGVEPRITVGTSQSIIGLIVDPSHATGHARLVHPLALAATVAGADGLEIEVHNDPPHARCDGAQSLTPGQFATLMDGVRQVLPLSARAYC